MPSPTVLYVVATVVIALLFAWVGLVSKSRAVAWEATPEERERFAKLRPFAEGDFAGASEADEAPAAKPKRKKAKAKPEGGEAKVEEGKPTTEDAEAKPAAEETEGPAAEDAEAKPAAEAPKAEVEETDRSGESDEKTDEDAAG